MLIGAPGITPAMSSFFSHTVACLIRLMHLLKVLLFTWLWLSYEIESHDSGYAVARKSGGVMHLNRSIKYEQICFIV